MSGFTWTPAQHRAIRTVDRQVLVSAAAGSGKTAVLAERAAALVCDAPVKPPVQTEDLLVLTFTDAAAAEMRNRIGQFIRKRLETRRHDNHLAHQLVRLDAARISTIHAFCLQTLRQWFAYAEVDPNAVVLDADEAELLRREVLEALFADLYDADDAAGARFRDLVTVYFDGRDENLASLLLRLDAFLQSIVDPHQWLEDAIDGFACCDPDRLRADLADRLAADIDTQIDWYRDTAEQFRDFGQLGRFYAERFDHYLQNLREWSKRAGQPDHFDALAETIAGFSVLSLHGHKQAAGDQADSSLDRLGQKLYRDMKEKLLQRGLQEKYTRLDLSRHAEALRSLEPSARTLIDLVRGFRSCYQREKQNARQLDFADFERKTLELLTTRHVNAPAQPVEQLRARYRYLLVDETQDVNPVQHAILHALCTPDENGRPRNLFTVGDLKQSIYRFRLAEPDLFRDAITALSDPENPGTCIPLRENFRSHPQLIHAVNALFERAMVPAVGGITYDETHALVPRPDADRHFSADDRPRFEIHLLQRKIDPDPIPADPEDDEPDILDLQAVEREAHFIARRIRRWIPHEKSAGAARAQSDDGPSRYGDICILLRSASKVADRIVRILRQHGIPARTDTGAGFFEALEIRDVLALLNLLDNARQDIPLAAVMRAPLLAEPFSESELARIRLTDPSQPFHAAAPKAMDAADLEPALREKLRRFFDRLENYRTLARRLPLPDVLWRIYHDHGYFAYVAGLPDPAPRRANLLHLHQRARQFATFTRQGLHRFLRFLNALREADRAAPSPPTPGHDDAVTVITIHKAKGLEFPLVFLADAARKFNDSDATGHILLHRRHHLAMRVVLPDVKLAYPTLPHTRVADAIRLETRAEEMRLLYVAATRAQRRFIVVASAEPDLYERQLRHWKRRRGPLPDLHLRAAGNYLDWILPAVAAQQRPEDLFRVTTHTADDMIDWETAEREFTPRPDPGFRRLAALAPFAPTSAEPRAADAHVRACIDRLHFVYPHESVAGLPAVVAASQVNRRLDYLIEPGESVRDLLPTTPPVLDGSQADAAESADATAARARGIAVHRFLQHLDLTRSCDVDDLCEQLRALTANGVVPASDHAWLDLDAIAWFASTDLAQRLRAANGDLLREWPFIAAFPPGLLDLSAKPENTDDRIIVRGIVDVLHVTPDGLEIIDYKTDRIAPDDAPSRAKHYKTQLDIYAHAATRIHRKPLLAAHLVFLHPRRIESVSSP